jgi:hypothetical protein
VLADTEGRLARVCKAVAKIRPAGPQLASLGKPFYAFSKAKPSFYPEEGWALMWQMDNEAKAQRAKSTPQSRLSTVSR